MAISNVSSLYYRIHRGAEGAMEFARILDKLLISESQNSNENYIAYSDRAGDYKGVDGIRIKGQDKIAFQYKFFPSPLAPDHKSAIKSSLANAVSKFPEMKKWIIVIPDDPNKNDLEWFESISNQVNCTTEMWGHKYIINLMLKHKHLGEEYYPELINNSLANNETKSWLSGIKIFLFVLLTLLAVYITYCVSNDKNNHRPATIR